MDFTWEYRYASVGHRYQSVSGVTIICLMQRDTSPLHRVDQAVDFGLLNVLRLFNGCAGYLRELEHAVVHVDPQHPKPAQLMTCLVRMQAMEELGHFQELCTDPCDMVQCMILLEHEVMAAD